MKGRSNPLNFLFAVSHCDYNVTKQIDVENDDNETEEYVVDD